MATQNEGPTVTFKAGEDLVQWALVKIEATTGDVVYTGGVGGEEGNVIGVTQEAVDNGDHVSVRMLNCVATCKVLAAVNDLAVGDLLYSAASGRVTDAVTSGIVVGVAMEVSGTIADIVEMAVIHSFEVAAIT